MRRIRRWLWVQPPSTVGERRTAHNPAAHGRNRRTDTVGRLDDRGGADEDLAEAFADVARRLQAERSPGEVLAGITIVRRDGSVDTPAADAGEPPDRR